MTALSERELGFNEGVEAAIAFLGGRRDIVEQLPAEGIERLALQLLIASFARSLGDLKKLSPADVAAQATGRDRRHE